MEEEIKNQEEQEMEGNIESPEVSIEEENEAANVEEQALDSESNNKEKLNEEAVDPQQDFNDKLLRMAAEMENLKRRNQQQIAELKKYAIQDFAKEVIGILENFYLIMENAPGEHIAQDEIFSKFFEGIAITKNDLTKVLEQSGVKRIYPEGEKFDHNFHQVVSQVDSDQESGTIIQVIQAGYVLNDRLLKEAMVVVAK